MTTNATPSFAGTPSDPATLVAIYQDVRRVTEDICAPLTTEDCRPSAIMGHVRGVENPRV